MWDLRQHHLTTQCWELCNYASFTNIFSNAYGGFLILTKSLGFLYWILNPCSTQLVSFFQTKRTLAYDPPHTPLTLALSTCDLSLSSRLSSPQPLLFATMIFNWDSLHIRPMLSFWALAATGLLLHLLTMPLWAQGKGGGGGGGGELCVDREKKSQGCQGCSWGFRSYVYQTPSCTFDHITFTRALLAKPGSETLLDGHTCQSDVVINMILMILILFLCKVSDVDDFFQNISITDHIL